MLNIKPVQLEAFERSGLEDFEDFAIEQLRIEIPEYVDGLSDTELLMIIQRCSRNLQRYGLNAYGEMLAYVEAALLLDDELFDQDPDYAWAPIVLRKRSLSAEQRSELLFRFAASEALPPWKRS